MSLGKSVGGGGPCLCGLYAATAGAPAVGAWKKVDGEPGGGRRWAVAWSAIVMPFAAGRSRRGIGGDGAPPTGCEYAGIFPRAAIACCVLIAIGSPVRPGATCGPPKVTTPPGFV